MGSGCKVTAGEWYDPYTDQTFTDPTDLDIDHVVALGNAWRSGASPWSDEERGETPGDEEVAVEDAIRGHYEAIGVGDFEQAYSYFGPSYRSEEGREGWVESHEADRIRSSALDSLEIEGVSDDAATAYVDVSFEDGSGTPRFGITWRLVKEGGRWKLDEQVSAEKLAA